MLLFPVRKFHIIFSHARIFQTVYFLSIRFFYKKTIQAYLLLRLTMVSTTIYFLPLYFMFFDFHLFFVFCYDAFHIHPRTFENSSNQKNHFWFSNYPPSFFHFNKKQCFLLITIFLIVIIIHMCYISVN